MGHVLAAALLVAQAACTSASPEATTSSSSGYPSTPTTGPSTTAPSPSGSVGPGGISNAVRIRPPDGGSFLVRGAYPRVRSRCVRAEQPSLLARYPGALSIERSTDGTLTITVTLPFERYLEGIAEVPPTWPREALEAQAVAARSYALATTGWSGAQGETLTTPICATTSCQVYRGIPVPLEPSVRRWYAAVRRTSDQVLLYGDRPADTVYFSTSNGRTYGNDVVFGSAPLPYLRPVVERDDGASPTSRWSVRLPFGDLARFLNAAGEWPRGRAISSIHLDGETIVISGAGASRSIELATFMDAVNDWAPCLEPARYPPDSLPVTVPSKWLSVSSAGNAAALSGRGWGHGVGMVQWGAYGKALRGLSASDILAYYYGGLRPVRYPEPGLIRVQVASGLTSVEVTPSAPGAMLDGRRLGLERLSISGGDELTVTTG
jgi:stage II sporulation protein D